MTDPETAPSGSSEPGAPEAGAPGSRAPEPPERREDPLRGSLASRTWAALIALGILLVVTVAFVAQNTGAVPLHLFGWTWHPPLAAALLAAAALGLAVALIAGSLRIVQLRRRVRRSERT